MRKHLKYLRQQKGLTLVELLAVLVILGIVAAIAVPMIGNIISDSKDKAILADAQQILSGAKLAYSNGEYKKEDNMIKFEKDVLKRYVDGVDFDNVNVHVEFKKDSKGEDYWVVDYEELKNIDNDKYKPATTGRITDKELAEKLKGSDE